MIAPNADQKPAFEVLLPELALPKSFFAGGGTPCGLFIQQRRKDFCAASALASESIVNAETRRRPIIFSVLAQKKKRSDICCT
jgi:hypothetical protein